MSFVHRPVTTRIHNASLLPSLTVRRQGWYTPFLGDRSYTRIFARIQTHRIRAFLRVYELSRDANETDSGSTDDDRTWGGLGMFEYSKKGLPHALVHAPELVETGGHHAAFCTAVSEVTHKVSLKRAAQFARTMASKNASQENMLDWVQRHEIYDCIQGIHNAITTKHVSSSNSPTQNGSSSTEEGGRRYKFWTPLRYCDNWQELDHRGNSFPPRWYSKFLSRDVMITREELLHLLRTKLGMNPTRSNLEKIRKHLFLRCYGAITINTPHDGVSRKISGFARTEHGRRDFVQLSGTESGTALAAQVRIRVRIAIKCSYTCIGARIRTHNICSRVCLYTCTNARIRTVCIRAPVFVYV